MSVGRPIRGTCCTSPPHVPRRSSRAADRNHVMKCQMASPPRAIPGKAAAAAAAVLSVDVPTLVTALGPIVRETIAEFEQGKLPDMPAEDDERTTIAIDMLVNIVQFSAVHTVLADLNEADIAFGDKPEIACLKGKKLKVKEKLGNGAFGNVFALDSKRCVKVIRINKWFSKNTRSMFVDEVALTREASKSCSEGAGRVRVHLGQQHTLRHHCHGAHQGS